MKLGLKKKPAPLPESTGSALGSAPAAATLLAAAALLLTGTSAQAGCVHRRALTINSPLMFSLQLQVRGTSAPEGRPPAR